MKSSAAIFSSLPGLEDSLIILKWFWGGFSIRIFYLLIVLKFEEFNFINLALV